MTTFLKFLQLTADRRSQRPLSLRSWSTRPRWSSSSWAASSYLPRALGTYSTSSYTVYRYTLADMGSGARHNFLASRQRNRASGTRKIRKMFKIPVSKWSSHKEHRHNAIIENMLDWKDGHVVASVFSCAQLYLVCKEGVVLWEISAMPFYFSAILYPFSRGF